MASRYINGASSTLNGDITAGQLTMTLTDGVQFNSGTVDLPQNITLIDEATGDMEIVHGTDRSAHVITIVRGQENTTPYAFPEATTIVEMRVTAEVLKNLDPMDGTTGVLNSIKMGIGASNTSSSDNSVTIGTSATSASTNSVTIGSNATNSTGASSAVAIGSGATVSDSTTIAIGSGAAASANYAVAIGRSTIASFASTIAIGDGADATALYATAIGDGPAASANYATAIGATAAASEVGAIAIGRQAKAYAPNSMAIGFDDESLSTFTIGSYSIGAFPAIQRENGQYWEDGVSGIYSQGLTSVIASPPVELAVGAGWVASTLYADQDVIIESGFQRYAVKSAYAPADGGVNTFTSGASALTWQNTVGDATGDGAAYWITILPTTSVTLSVGKGDNRGWGARMKFYPTRVGFVCQKYTANTALPFISCGNEVSGTAYVNNVQLTGIANNHQVHWIDVTDAQGAEDIVWKLNTAGTGAGSEMQGRFLVEGFYLQTQD